jgi:hypothetical protein
VPKPFLTFSVAQLNRTLNSLVWGPIERVGRAEVVTNM